MSPQRCDTVRFYTGRRTRYRTAQSASPADLADGHIVSNYAGRYGRLNAEDPRHRLGPMRGFPFGPLEVSQKTNVLPPAWRGWVCSPH